MIAAIVPIPRWSECKTDDDRWRWQARTYAHRIERGAATIHDKTSPCDPNGDWYDRGLIEAALRELAASRPLPPRRDDLALEGRAICNDWARQRGYADFDTAFAAGRTYSEVIASIFAAAGDKLKSRRQAPVKHHYATATEHSQSPAEEYAA
jgi:hypothetical protein